MTTMQSRFQKILAIRFLSVEQGFLFPSTGESNEVQICISNEMMLVKYLLGLSCYYLAFPLNYAS